MTAYVVSANLPFVVTNRDDEVFGVLSDSTRRAIVLQLAEAPQAVGAKLALGRGG